jgi:hypothetical protein
VGLIFDGFVPSKRDLFLVTRTRCLSGFRGEPCEFILAGYYFFAIMLADLKLMSSKNMPTRLVFTRGAACNSSGSANSKDPLFTRPRYKCFFKNGNDLRQDVLILQVMNMMRDLWAGDQLFVHFNTRFFFGADDGRVVCRTVHGQH